jgi:hypothetical protein
MGTLLGGKDACYADMVAREINELAGTTIKYYVLLQSESPVDPLYGEPKLEAHINDTNRGIEGVCLPGFLWYPDQSQKPTDGGISIEYDATIEFTHSDFKRAFKQPEFEPGVNNPMIPRYRDPRVGDIIECQNRFYDVLKIDYDGQLDDEVDVHTMFQLKVKNRSTFDARRRIQGP